MASNQNIKREDERSIEALLQRYENAFLEDIKKPSLVLFATPLGNLADISLRTLAYIKKFDAIFCEDTRNTRKLLSAFNITKTLFSYHENNKESAGEMILKRLAKGELIGLCSDAGLPCISDPGSEIVSACREAGYNVIVLPGASALTAALAGSGLNSQNFYFAGFLPREKTKRDKILQVIRGYKASLIFYEAPHRLSQMLTSLCQNGLAKRKAILLRELSKRYENWHLLRVEELLDLSLHENLKGEMVLVIDAPCASEPEEAFANTKLEQNFDLEKIIKEKLASNQALKTICSEIAEEYKLRKNEVYKLALELKNN